MAFALRFACVYVALTAVMYAWGEAYSRVWLAPLERATAFVGSELLTVDRIETARFEGQRVFRLKAHTAREVRTSQRAAPRGTKVQTTTPQANAHHHLILIFSVLAAAWPLVSRQGAVLTVVSGAAAIVATTLIDIPFALTGVWRDALLAAVDPQALRSDPGVLYFQFLQRGGRPVLSLSAALLVIALVKSRQTSPAVD